LKIQSLNDASLVGVRPGVRLPAYDRSATRIGVVHFGPGAFHRAHQAYYFDRMLEHDPGFAISAVSLRSDDVRAALEPQDGLYSLTEREAQPIVRVIGSIREVLTAPRSPDAVFARLTDPAVRIVSATVTEKGYCLTPAGDLDLDNPQVRRDLDGTLPPQTLVGWLVEGLRRRRAAGHAPPTVISCDNLSGNGERFRRSAIQFADAAGHGDLARWIEGEVTFPDTMVDSITPATDEALRAEATERLGLVDAWPVQRERFVQWVVADELGDHARAFAAAGVTLAGDVAAFERAKLRLLNGAHSTLAYVGLGMGYESVFEAMSDKALSGFVETMMRKDMAATLAPTAGLDPSAYIAQILARFRNPAIVHKLAQIAGDGSQKLPFRLLAPIAETLAAGRRVDRLVVGVAAWMRFVRRQALAGATIVDPLSAELAAIGRGCSGVASDDVAAFLAFRPVFTPELAGAPRLRSSLETAYRLLGERHPQGVLGL
jgi:fructuronate reductase